jgi:hypothetical protein
MRWPRSSGAMSKGMPRQHAVRVDSMTHKEMRQHKEEIEGSSADWGLSRFVHLRTCGGVVILTLSVRLFPFSEPTPLSAVYFSLAIPSTLAPDRLDASSRNLLSRLDCHPHG